MSTSSFEFSSSADLHSVVVLLHFTADLLFLFIGSIFCVKQLQFIHWCITGVVELILPRHIILFKFRTQNKYSGSIEQVDQDKSGFKFIVNFAVKKMKVIHRFSSLSLFLHMHSSQEAEERRRYWVKMQANQIRGRQQGTRRRAPRGDSCQHPAPLQNLVVSWTDTQELSVEGNREAVFVFFSLLSKNPRL